MARADTIELLTSLIDDLAPLGAMTPGRPLRADEWNGLVDALRTMAQLAVSRERTTSDYLDDRYARLDHEHAGQIDLEWFEPKTRTLLEENVSGPVEQRAELKALRGEVAELRAGLEKLQQQVTGVRADVDGLRDADAARVRDIDRVAVRVESLRDVEGRVTGLDSRLVSIATDLDAALEFRNELRDASGAPIDVGAFAERIDDLETLRENLRTADGSIVQIREIESAIARLEDNTLTRGDLDAAVLGRLQDAELVAQTGLVETVRGGVEDTFADRFAGLDSATAEFREDLNFVRDAIAGEVERLGEQETRLADAEGRLVAVEGLSGRLDEQQIRLAAMDARLLTVQTATADLPSLRADLTLVQTAVADFGIVRTTVTALDGRLDAVEVATTAIDGLVTSTQQTATRVGAIELSLPALREATDLVRQQADRLATLDTRVQAAEAELDDAGDLGARLATIDKQVSAMTAVQTTTTQRIDALTASISGLDAIGLRLTAVEAATAEQRQSLAATTDRVAKVETSVTSLTSTLDTRIRTLEQVVLEGRLIARVSELETSMLTVSQIVPTVQTLNTTVARMDTRMTRLETTRPIIR